jgi:hypothetical protein
MYLGGNVSAEAGDGQQKEILGEVKTHFPYTGLSLPKQVLEVAHFLDEHSPLESDGWVGFAANRRDRLLAYLLQTAPLLLSSVFGRDRADKLIEEKPCDLVRAQAPFDNGGSLSIETVWVP